MRLPVDINAILQGRSSVEWERIEFKAGWNAQPILHTLCAFANDFHNLDGGYIFIGVSEDNGRPSMPPVGLEPSQVEPIQKELLRLGFDKIRPAYHPVAEPCEVDGKTILVLRAPGGQNRPYQALDSLAKDEKSWSYFIRKMSSTVKARDHDRTELMSLAQTVPFDDRYNQQASTSDLKPLLIKSYLTEVNSALAEEMSTMSYEQLCRRMNIVGGASELPMPKNVGLMFFSEEPDRFFPQTQIDVVRFPNGLGADVLIEKTFRGPISSQVRDALQYIRNSVLEAVIVKRPRRAEAGRYFNYPYAALEEVLVNAVYHRSYEVREPIEIRVLPDHITITSYPGPDRSISIEALASGQLIARRYRNRRIGDFFKELRLTEGRGTGIPKAIRAMILNGSPQPRFETDADRTYFTTILPIHPSAIMRGGGGEKAGVTPTSLPPSSPDLRSLLNEKAIALLSFCAVPHSRSDIQSFLGMNDRKHVRERYLYPLLNTQLLEMTDPDNPLSRTQMFRTTALGAAAVELYGSDDPEIGVEKPGETGLLFE